MKSTTSPPPIFSLDPLSRLPLLMSPSLGGSVSGNGNRSHSTNQWSTGDDVIDDCDGVTGDDLDDDDDSATGDDVGNDGTA